MSPVQILVLALVQGVTEFLPISSSAHLILVPHLFGWQDQGLAFDVAVHAGTLGAVVVYSRRQLRAIVASLWGQRHGAEARASRRLLGHLAVATVPVVVAGYLLQDLVAGQARNVRLLATTSIVFGVLLGWADRWGRRERCLADLGLGDAVWVGVAQALALVPGTSRSGVTLTAGLWRRLERPAAVELSFLLAIPVLVAATAKDVFDLVSGEVAASTWFSLLAAGVVSGLTGYGVMGWLIDFSRRRSLLLFAVYRVLLGVVLLLAAPATNGAAPGV